MDCPLLIDLLGYVHLNFNLERSRNGLIRGQMPIRAQYVPAMVNAGLSPVIRMLLIINTDTKVL